MLYIYDDYVGYGSFLFQLCDDEDSVVLLSALYE